MIKGNTITYCGRYTGSEDVGIYLNSSFDYPSLDTLLNNTITNNGAWQYNNIYPTSYASGGVSINGYSQVVMNYNNIYNNGGKGVINNIDKAIIAQQNAKYNYWGDSTTAEMNLGSNPKNISKIYDEYDNSAKGFVNYGGYLNAAHPNGIPTSTTTAGTIDFVDRLGVSVLNYAQTDTLRLSIADADRNISATTVDTVSVRVRSDKETTSEKITLTESGANTGIFKANVFFNSTSAVVNNDGILQVNRGDKLVATYLDPADDFGNTTVFSANSFYGMTTVPSGSLSANTTWTKANSPYFLTGDITVPDAVTLTIDPGVVVRFKAITDDLSSGVDGNRIEIRVSGTLKANGTATDSIFFMSNGQVPAAGDWYGLVSYNESGGINKVGTIDISYTRLSHYVTGVQVRDQGAWNATFFSTDSIKIYNSVFYAGGSLISSTSGSYTPVDFCNNTAYN